MSIVKMKRVRIIAMEKDKSELMDALLRAGCVEVREPEPVSEDESWGDLLQRSTSDLSEARLQQNELKQAMSTLQRFAPQKSSLLSPRPQIGEREFLDREALKRGLCLADEINGHAEAIGQLGVREARLRAERAGLLPWENYDVPLELRGTKTVEILLGTVPNSTDFHTMAGAVAESAEASALTLLGQDGEQQYLEVLCHQSCRTEALETLRSFGFAFAQLRELTGTIRENLERLDKALADIRSEQESQQEQIRALGGRMGELKLCSDRLQQVISTESAKEKLLVADSILYLDGWVPDSEAAGLEGLLVKYDCAYELREPVEEEYPIVPVQLKNGPLTKPLNMVTEMYSLPAYDGVDPNPLMAPFFVTFFGLMMADMAYGIIMMVGGWFLLKKMHAKGTMAHIGGLGLLCGATTFLFGALTGGFFGDFIPQIAKIINPASTLTLPALFTPLDDTIAILVGSLVLGVIQIFTGMGISVVRKIQSGDFVDALFSEITWWIILAGIALAIFGIGTVAGVPVVLVVGVLMLAIGGTRNAKGFGKVTSFIGLVYNGVSGYFSDTFSYARLMALMLAGSVIAQVFNTLGAVTGNVVGFVLISLVGNTLNLVLNLLGCYVHDLRLQCLEFFGRFYKEGGKPFRPLAIQTKYVDIMKEEQ